MSLKRIFVDELFGCYKYDLSLFSSKQSHITIIDSPNGMGKTTILRLIQATLEGDIRYIDTIPFSKFGMEFDEGKTISIEKKDTFSSVLNRNVAKLRNQLAHSQELVESAKDEDDLLLNNIKYIVNGEEFSISFQREILTSSVRRGRYDRDYMTDLSVLELISRYEFGDEEVFSMEGVMPALRKFSDGLQIYSIKTNRLYKRNEDVGYGNDRFRSYVEPDVNVVSAVELYKKKLKREIMHAGKEFADKSEELDRAFPQKVLNIIFKKENAPDIYDKETIEIRLKELEQTRSELSELGLITVTGDSLVKIPAGEELSDQTRIFLTNYIEDNITKLEIYKSLAGKLELLQNIINERNIFSDKEMKFSSTEGVVFVSSRNGRTIPIDKLSSGEKNNFVLFYELIFECNGNSLILVDEPEISLHVAWQRQFIDELNEICKLKGLQGIVATHSPDIVGDNNEFMIDLEDLSDGEE